MARQSFPQGQGAPILVEVDLESGITTLGSNLRLMRGAQSVGLRTSTNLIWQPRYALSPDPELHGLAYPIVPQLLATTLTFGATFPSHVLGVVTMPAGLRRRLLVTRLAASPYSIQVWRHFGGSVTAQAILGGTSTIGSAADDATTGLQIVQAYWRAANFNHPPRNLNPGSDSDMTDAGEPEVTSFTQTGIMFFSHPASTHIYMVDTNGAVESNAVTPGPSSPSPSTWGIRSYTNINADPDANLHMDFGSVAAPAGANALKIHLDRLWMAHFVSDATGTNTQGRYTQIWYTDPNNWRMIRPENFIMVEDSVRALATPTTGGIGTGGQAQLVIFGYDTISVLDGDPTQGNSFYRILANNIGVVSQKSVIETPYGIVFIATDRQAYLIPAGAQRLIPIGDAVRGDFVAHTQEEVNYTQPAVQLYWHSPYVYVLFGDIASVLMFDLSKPDAPKWWGPIVGAYADPVVGETFPNNLDSTGSNRTLLYSHRPNSNQIRTLDIEMIPSTPPNLGSLSNSIQTGALHVPGHRVQVDRVFIQQFTKAALPTIGVSARTAEGGTFTAKQYGHPLAGPVDPLFVNHPTRSRITGFTFGAHGPASDYIYLDISGTAGAEPRINKIYILMRVQPLSW